MSKSLKIIYILCSTLVLGTGMGYAMENDEPVTRENRCPLFLSHEDLLKFSNGKKVGRTTYALDLEMGINSRQFSKFKDRIFHNQNISAQFKSERGTLCTYDLVTNGKKSIIPDRIQVRRNDKNIEAEPHGAKVAPSTEFCPGEINQANLKFFLTQETNQIDEKILTYPATHATLSKLKDTLALLKDYPRQNAVLLSSEPLKKDKVICRYDLTPPSNVRPEGVKEVVIFIIADVQMAQARKSNPLSRSSGRVLRDSRKDNKSQ